MFKTQKLLPLKLYTLSTTPAGMGPPKPAALPLPFRGMKRTAVKLRRYRQPGEEGPVLFKTAKFGTLFL